MSPQNKREERKNMKEEKRLLHGRRGNGFVYLKNCFCDESPAKPIWNCPKCGSWKLLWNTGYGYCEICGEVIDKITP